MDWEEKKRFPLPNTAAEAHRPRGLAEGPGEELVGGI